MVDKDVLSQEEIDALLNSVDEDVVADDESATESESVNAESTITESIIDDLNLVDSGADKPREIEVSPGHIILDRRKSNKEVRVVNFTNQERIVRGELPVLEKIHDRAIKLFANDLYQLITRDLEFTQEPLAVVRYKEIMTGMSNPTLTLVYRFKPLRGKAVIFYDSSFIYGVVDYYFGGGAQFVSIKDRIDYTATELRVMDIITNQLVKNIEQSWAPIIQLEATKQSQESNPQLVHFCEPNEMLLVSKFTLNFGKEMGSFSLVFPYSMFEPIKQRLEFGASRPDDEVDPNWMMLLKEEVMDVELTLKAAMVDTMSTLGKVIDWQEGDFIALDMKDTVTLDIEDTPCFTGTLGVAGEQRAVKIIKKIN